MWGCLNDNDRNSGVGFVKAPVSPHHSHFTWPTGANGPPASVMVQLLIGKLRAALSANAYHLWWRQSICMWIYCMHHCYMQAAKSSVGFWSKFEVQVYRIRHLVASTVHVTASYYANFDTFWDKDPLFQARNPQAVSHLQCFSPGDRLLSAYIFFFLILSSYTEDAWFIPSSELSGLVDLCHFWGCGAICFSRSESFFSIFAKVNMNSLYFMFNQDMFRLCKSELCPDPLDWRLCNMWRDVQLALQTPYVLVG